MSASYLKSGRSYTSHLLSVVLPQLPPVLPLFSIKWACLAYMELHGCQLIHSLCTPVCSRTLGLGIMSLIVGWMCHHLRWRLETWSHTSAMKRQHNGEDWFNMDEKKNKVRERLAVALGAITPRPVPWPSLHIMSSSEPFSVERARSSELTYSSSMYSSGSAWNAWPFVRAPGMYSSGVGRRTASTPPPQRTRLSSMASPPCRELGNFGKLRCPPR